MRWVLRDIWLVPALVVAGGILVLEAIGTVADIDTLLEQEIGRLTGGELLIALFVLACVVVIVRLLFRLANYEGNRPEFEVLPANFLFSMRVKVTNVSPSAVSVSARAEGISKHMATEPFLLGWEETKENQLPMNPGDHGTITIGVGKAIKEGVAGIEPYISHFVELHSRNADGKANFRFFEHLEHQNPGGYTLRLHLFPDKASSKKKYTYDFDVHHEHPQQAFWLHPIPTPPGWWTRTYSAVRSWKVSRGA